MIRTALRNPYLIVVIALAFMALGLVSYGRIPRDLLPQFETSAVQIVCFYPGMPPEVMEKDIMSRLQRWTGQSVGIEHQEAKAMQGVCVVKDFFREGISMDTAMSQVTSYAMSDMFYLPPGTIPPMVMPFDPTASLPLCLVVVANEQMDEQQLYDIAYYELRNKLQSISGVIAPAVYGGKLRRILGYVEQHKLAQFGMSLMDVQKKLLQQNVLIPAGSIKIGDEDLHIFTNAIPEKVEELNDVPVKVVDGQVVEMKRLGRVENTSQIQSNIVRINGQRQVYIPIYRQPGANTIEIVASIKRQLRDIEVKLKQERIEDPLMKSLVLSVAMDQSEGVKKSITSLQWAAGLGAVLAALVVVLFLRSFRSTVIVLLAIPLAIFVAIVALYLRGDTINSMTLGGLALAIGILVDQSIVVLENVVRHAHMGKTPVQAAYDGTAEVALPLLVSTITFCAVFVPVMFLTGLAKYLFTPLAVSACVAIVASFFLSITLVPAYCSRFLRVRQTGTSSGHEESSGPLADWYAKMLSMLLVFRLPVIGVAGVLFVFAFTALLNMGTELFPQVDAGQFTLYVRMPSGTRIEKTEETVAKIEQVILDEIGNGKADPGFRRGTVVWENKNLRLWMQELGIALPEWRSGEEKHPDSDVQMLISNIGVLMDWPAAYTPNNGPMDAFMLVQLKGKGSVFDYVERLRKKLAEEFSDVEFAFDTGGMMTAALNMGEPSPIHFQVASTNLELAQEIGREIVDAAESVDGTADVRIAQRIDYPTLEIHIDRKLAALQGITTEDVMKNLVSATNSSINFDPAFWVDKFKGNHYFFGVQYPEKDLQSYETIKNIPVGGSFDKPRRLGNVAKIRRGTAPAVVFHRNITRVTDVYANIRPGYDVGSVASKIEAKLKQLGALPGLDSRGRLFRLGPKSSDKENDPLVKRHNELRLADKDYAGFSIRLLGEVKAMRDSFKRFTFGLILAAVLVYLAMVAQFRSFLDPFVVILTVPLGFIGVVALLMLTGTHLSIMSFMGIIMMVGIVVEYSIVLVDFANRRVEDGLSPRDAIIDAAKVRLRPILMTSMTTWIALLPMATGLLGSAANAPLARAIIGGVLGATVLSLSVVPCLYVIFKRPGRREEDNDGPIAEVLSATDPA